VFKAGTTLKTMPPPQPEHETNSGPRPLILHLSADYPDPYRGRTTTAVERLLQRVPDADHVVISLLRTSNPGKTAFIDCGTSGGIRLIAYRYFSPPMGILLAPFMRVVARKVLQFLKAEDLRPSVIHAHKFAFEGIAALWLAEKLGPEVRLLVSVRGEAERKVLVYKRNYRGLMRRIAARADRIYHVSAWFRRTFHTHIPDQPDKERLLPNIVDNSSAMMRTAAPINRFVSVLNLEIRKRKGLTELLKGFSQFSKDHPGIGLDLIGPGSEDTVTAVNQEISDLGLQDSVAYLGPMQAEELFEALRKYLGMALVSHNETFGMVYLEALFAGIPIMYGKETGIDGYLSDIRAGVGVKPGDIDGIAIAFRDLCDGNADFRREIAAAAKTLHDRFDPEMIAGSYRKDLQTLLSADRQRSQVT
jgi:glycosyltransferase involved in cell wall biosynthesis